MLTDTFITISLEDFIRTVKKWGDLTSPSTEDHEVRSSVMAGKIADRLNGGERLNANRKQLLKYAMDIHDCGKRFLNQAIVDKASKLNEAEWEHMKLHTTKGYESFELIPMIPYEITSVILYHHEHWDGSGYPDGLKGLEIPLFPRIACIADVWDALTSARPYRAAMTAEASLEEMNRCINWFDPKLFVLFLRIVREQEA